MSDELLPCPFCGDIEPWVSEDDYGYARWVCCSYCECYGPPIPYQFEGTKEEARELVIESWNQRAQQEKP